MYSVSAYLRHYNVEVARQTYPDLQSALSGRIELLERLVRRQGMKVRVTAVRRIS